MNAQKKFLVCAALLAGCLFWCAGLPAQARTLGSYGFMQTDEGVMWVKRDGSPAKEEWVELDGKRYYFGADGYAQIGLQRIDGETYYLNPEAYTGWYPTDEGVYYFGEDGKMVRNTTAEGYTFNGSGKAQVEEELTEKLTGVVDEILRDIITPEMTEAQQLRACYKYMVTSHSYLRDYDTPFGNWTSSYAYDILSTGQGNCYRYASGFAALASRMGFDVRVITGQVKARRGGTTPHSWAEVCLDGDWYIFDCELEAANGNDLYKKTYKEYPIKPLNKEHEYPIDVLVSMDVAKAKASGEALVWSELPKKKAAAETEIETETETETETEAEIETETETETETEE